MWFFLSSVRNNSSVLCRMIAKNFSNPFSFHCYFKICKTHQNALSPRLSYFRSKKRSRPFEKLLINFPKNNDSHLMWWLIDKRSVKSCMRLPHQGHLRFSDVQFVCTPIPMAPIDQTLEFFNLNQNIKNRWDVPKRKWKKNY